MKLRSLLLLIATTITLSLSSQDYETQFIRAFQSNDTTQMLQTLKQWEKSNPNDAELLTAYLNYYFLRSQYTTMQMALQEPHVEYLVMFDSINNRNIYLYEEVNYNLDTLDKGIAYIDKAIELYPNRLDLYFGKAYLLADSKQWQRHFQTLNDILKQNNGDASTWLWSKNKPIEDAEEFFISNIQEYLYYLFETGIDSLMPNIREVSLQLSKQYPQRVEPLDNIASTYLMLEDVDNALIWFKKAEAIAPTDFIVLANTARLYEIKGDNANAIIYYLKIQNNGDEQEKAFATERIQNLK